VDFGVAMKVLGVIPARYDSTRFPGKPLALLCGKPLVQWVWERACRATMIDRVVVATDDERIRSAVESFGGEVCMTAPSHPSGTDRVAEVAERFQCDFVVNIQGDEPLLDPRMLEQAVRALVDGSSYDVATLCKRIESRTEIEASSVVKVVKRYGGEALYFSRHPIPFNRDGRTEPHYFKHVGLYVFRKESLRKIVRLPVSPLEDAEKLEQLRVLENGFRILVEETEFDSIGVDTPEDLEQAERLVACNTKRFA